MYYQRVLSLLCVGGFAMQLLAGPESAESTAAVPSAPASQGLSVKDIEELRRNIAEQQKQIESLQKSLTEQQSLLENTVKMVAAGAASTGTAAVPRLVLAGGPNAQAVQPSRVEPPASAGQKESVSPLSFKIGDADFTPFGFMDFTYIGRSTNTGSGIGTGFGSIPFGNNYAGHIAESNFSAQNSRVGLRVDSTVAGAKVLGYLEADFLGNQAPNVFVTSNSDTLRLRNYFVDVKKGPLELMAGQDWSLLVPGRRGISPLPSELFYSQDIDTNYQLGLTWARQAQFRIGYHPNDHFHLVMSAENPQQYVGSTGVTYPAALATSGALANQFNDGTTNYKAPNLHPDVIVKAAFDAKPKGLAQHIEVAGLVRSFKYFDPLPAVNHSFRKTGGGWAVNSNFEIFKGFRLVENAYASDGGGRYIFGLGPDLVIRPDGNISLVHAYSTVDGFEANLSKNLMLYSYYGGAYYGRNYGIDTNGKSVGYGYAGSSSSSNRSLQEYTIGLTQTFWEAPRYGALQLMTQYSYVWRNPWFVATGSPKNAKTNMVYVNLRYTVP
jgi:hypothetical protein